MRILEATARLLEDVLIMLLLRSVMVSSSWRDVRSRKYELAPVFDYAGLQRLNTEHAAFLYEQVQDFQKKTDEKVAHLLTLSGSLAGFTSIVGALVIANIVSTFVVGALVSCVVLCLATLTVRIERIPDLYDSSLDDYDIKWARELLRSANHNYNRHAYRVDVFRAARRWFFVAMLGGVALIVVQWIKPGASPFIDTETVGERAPEVSD